MRCGARILILGYGNLLRGDDGFGCQAARRLAAAIEDPAVDVRELHQLIPELAEPVSQASHVVFIDAAREGAPAELRRTAVAPAAAGAFSHQLTPSALLAASRDLYGRAPGATLFTAAGVSFEYSTCLSQPMQAALCDVCRQVLSLVQEL
jgi:hydrogenase maturation protease